MPHPPPSRRSLAALFALGLLVRLPLVVLAGVKGPVGEDASMWGYRALELAKGVWHGSHPPLYPALGVALSASGLDLGLALAGISWAAGLLMAPVFAWGASKLVGARAGLVAGACLLVQPALTAWSLRIEPSALFMVLLGLLLGALGEALHQGSRRAAVGADRKSVV